MVKTSFQQAKKTTKKHEKLRSEIKGFCAGQGNFKGRIIDMLNKPLKGSNAGPESLQGNQ
jgi:hypothetical protein